MLLYMFFFFYKIINIFNYSEQTYFRKGLKLVQFQSNFDFESQYHTLLPQEHFLKGNRKHWK